jgi:hypothetical protein
MSLLEKMVYVTAGILGLLIVGSSVAYWWTSRVPNRPSGVGTEAVFLWAPAVGLPSPRRGSWLGCSEENEKILCQLNNIDGRLEYKGEFVRYGDKAAISSNHLRIDSIKTNRYDDKVWVDRALVPLAYLENGDILVPAIKYQESVRLLQQRQQTH